MLPTLSALPPSLTTHKSEHWTCPTSSKSSRNIWIRINKYMSQWKSTGVCHSRSPTKANWSVAHLRESHTIKSWAWVSPLKFPTRALGVVTMGALGGWGYLALGPCGVCSCVQHIAHTECGASYSVSTQQRLVEWKNGWLVINEPIVACSDYLLL